MDAREVTSPADGATAADQSSSTTATTTAGDGLGLRNRLAESRSPYVRAHMHNPVAWQEWTPETLELARQSNRLLFVSIGYAACHWCHVMERESFENADVARALNAGFIPVKVDREERPDVDRIYMNYVQATTGGGGWPLNVFLTPGLEPLFGGTYWPGPSSSTGDAGMSFLQILGKMADVWEHQRQRCLDSAKEITKQLQQFAQEGSGSRPIGGDGDDDDGKGAHADEEGDELDLELLDDAYEHFARNFDRQHAGFGGAPKFPTPSNLTLLLRLGQFPDAVRDVVGDKDCAVAQDMAVQTLRAMARGGIHDQIGEGFARYSVTRDWSLPHFEKMLYDQAQLLSTYTDAYLITRDDELLAAVHDIATYLTSAPIRSEAGGLFSSEDADSKYRPSDTEKREGAFYVWTLKEFQSLLGDRDAAVAARYWNVKENGNVRAEHDAHDELINQNVLAVSSTPDALAREFGLTRDEIAQLLDAARAKLRAHRDGERPRPALDDKIVVAWNGLAIGALARASCAVEEAAPEAAARYRDAAARAASFIRRELWDLGEGRLWRVWREGRGDVQAFADDYAFLIHGLIDLYEATWDDSWLQWADRLQKTQISLFYDEAGPSSAGFFSTPAGAPDLILRLKDGMDNAEPSANGVSALNLHRLASMLDDDAYAALARRTLGAFAAEILQHPFLFPSLLQSVVARRLGVRSVQVVAGEGDGDAAAQQQGQQDEKGQAQVDDVERLVRGLRRGVGANRTVVRIGGAGVKSDWLRRRNELLKLLDTSRTRVTVCEARACRDLSAEELAALTA